MGQKTNCELYKLILCRGYKISQANMVMRLLQNEGLISVFDIEKQKEARKNSFYLSYANAKDTRHPKAYIKIKKDKIES